MSCISSYWDDYELCQCPLCKETFDRRPDLKVNTFISELSSQFRSLQVKDAHMMKPVQPQTSCEGPVLCDICSDTQQTAVKSCLECLTSFCDVHLEPHHRAAGLKRHTLVEPVSSLEDRICKEHARLLTAFCRAEQLLICDVCCSLKHIDHDVISVQRAYEEVRATLNDSESYLQQKIEERLQDVQAMKESLDKSKSETKSVIAESVQELTELVSEIHQSQTKLVQVIKERQKAAEKQANGYIVSTEQEITHLETIAAKISELKQSEDHVYLLLNMPKISLQWPTMNSLTFNFNRHVDIHHIRECLSKTVSDLRKHLRVMDTGVQQLFIRKDLTDNLLLNNLRYYVVDVCLDADTAHPLLIVSKDRKQVRYNTGLAFSGLTLKPTMFTAHLAVLGDTAISTYKFYFEVFVGGKTEWCLGLANESIQRRGEIPRRPGCGLWAIWFIQDKFETFCAPNLPVHYGKVERVGVFVRYERDSIEFYDVQTMTEIYRFTDCSFTEKLYPYLNPCDNEYGSNLGPMIIVPLIPSNPYSSCD